VIEWEVTITQDGTGSLAVELPFVLSPASTGFTTTLYPGSGIVNGAPNQTWYYNETFLGSGVLVWNTQDDPNNHDQNLGANPFTMTNTEGLYVDTAGKVFFSALGSGVNLPDPVPTLHVASSDGELTWSDAIIAEEGETYLVSGMATSILVGDLNGDGELTFAGDFAPFQLAKTNPAGYEALFPGLDYRARGDLNGDGMFDDGDVFVPEPASAIFAIMGALALGLVRRRSG
jgi:hypothetical protein